MTEIEKKKKITETQTVEEEQNWTLGKQTFNQEEEAQDPSWGDDESWDDEGHSPFRGHEDSGDEGAQDVSHGCVGVPNAHDETTSDNYRDTQRSSKQLSL